MIGSGKLSASGGDGFGYTRGASSRETALTLRTKLGITAITFPASGLLLHAGQLGVVNGIATLDSAGKLTPSQIPPLTLAVFLGQVASQSAMLALTGSPGDWCVRSDLATMFILTGTSTLLAGWTEVDLPASPVTSVAGRTGVVTLNKADVGLANVDNTSDATKPVSAAVASALTGRVPTTRTVNGYPLSANITLTAADLGVTPYTLPVPTASVIGGVKRNAGTSGQFVTGIATDGSLVFATPDSGGGGTGTVESLTLGTLTGLSGSVSGSAYLTLSLALAAPTTTVLGGVKRNAGTGGQFVTGIASDGSLIYATPAGGGGGGLPLVSMTPFITLAEVSGTIQLDLASPLVIEKGGTGASSAVGARVNLGVNLYDVPSALAVTGGRAEFSPTPSGCPQLITTGAAFILAPLSVAYVGNRAEVWVKPSGTITVTLGTGTSGQEIVLADTSHLVGSMQFLPNKTYIFVFRKISTTAWALVSLTGGY